MEATGKPAMVVKCEKHGLHYDSARQSGCVLCRREAGELPGATAPSSRGAAQAAAGGSLGGALAVTVVLIVLTMFAMRSAHGAFIDWLRAQGNPTPMDARSEYEKKQMDGALKALEEQGGGGEGESEEEPGPTP